VSHPVVTFDPVAHRYTLLPAETRLPSVTDILRETGISTNFEALAHLGAQTAADIEAKRDLGRVVHADAHAFDDDDLDWATVDPRVRPYLEAWATFRANQQLTPVARERLVYHPGLGYAGTLDGIFTRRTDGRTVLVDIKLGDPEDAGGRYQTAAYQLAYCAERPGVVIHERLCVWLRPDLGVPYRVFPYTDWRDLQVWPAIVTTYFCGQAARRL
jgi:hypothetical protein